MKGYMLLLLERICYRIAKVLHNGSEFFRANQFKFHKKARFESRYGIKYSKGIEKNIIKAILSKNSSRYFIKKDGIGGSIYKIKIRGSYFVYPIYRQGRIRTYLTKEMVYAV